MKTTIILIIIFLIILAFYIYIHIYEAKRAKSNWYHVGTLKYTDKNEFIHKNFRFQDQAHMSHHTADYQPVLFLDDSHPEFKQNDILLFNCSDCPNNWRHHYILMRRDSDQTYRIAKCKSYDTITSFPPLFDGSETVGIGYTIIGFLQFKINDDDISRASKTYF